MGSRATGSALESPNDPEPRDRLHAVLLVYGSEPILPTDLDYGAPRVRTFNEQGYRMALEDAMDQIDKARDIALLHSVKYQQALRRYHDRNVKSRGFNVGDLVLRRIESNKGRHKLTPPWEGSFIVPRVLRPGSYKLKTSGGQEIGNAWNIAQLRKFYP